MAAPTLLSSLLSLTVLATSGLVTASPHQALSGGSRGGNVPRGGSSYAGKMTWIGDTTGAYTSCGAPYEADSMYVAVNPSLLGCPVSGGAGAPMTITCNGQTISATAIDKCMGCDPNHIDVATAVYEACGFSTTDGGMQDSGISWSF